MRKSTKRMRMIIFRNLIFTFLFLFYSISKSFAQSVKEIDSLNFLIEHTNDTIKISALIELSKLICETDAVHSKQYALRALDLAKKTQNKIGINKSYIRLAAAIECDNKLDSSIQVYVNTMKLAEQTGDTLSLAICHQNIGAIYTSQNNLKMAMNHYSKSVHYLNQINNIEYLSKLYNNIGAIKRKETKFDEALNYYRKSLAIKEKLNDQKGINKSYFNMAIVYEYKGLLDSSIQMIRHSIDFDLKYQDNFNLAHDYITLGEIYIKKNRLQEADAIYDSALYILQQSPSNFLIVNAYGGKLIIDTLRNNYKQAFYHLQKMKTYNDALYNEEVSNKISTLEAIYENDKKEQKINYLELDKKIKSKQLRQKNVILILTFISMALLTLLTGVVYFALQRKKKDNNRLQQQKIEIEQKTDQVKEQAAHIATLQSQMNPHFIYNALSELQNIIAENKIELANHQLAEFAKLMRSTLNNSSKKTISLHDEIDFIQRYISFEQKNVRHTFQFNMHIDESIDLENCLLPPMLIQPLLENSIKHGFCGMSRGILNLYFSKQNDSLHIIIDDNGKGRSEHTNDQHISKGSSITFQRIEAFNKENNFIFSSPFIYTDKKDEIQHPIGTKIDLHLYYKEEY